MFVLGLLVGPAIGLLLTDLALRRQLGALAGTAIVALVAIFLLFVPVLHLELKLGLIIGTVLGALLVITPARVSPAEG